MQVSTFSAQVVLGLELVYCYGDAKPAPCGLLLIDSLPRTDDRLRYRTKTGSIPSKFHVSERLKHLMSLDDKHTTFFCSPIVPISFPQGQNHFPHCCRKDFRRFQKKASRRKISKSSSNFVSKKNDLEAKKRHFGI